MRVLIVHPTLGVGGAETQIVNLARFLTSRGHTVGVATLFVDPETRRSLPGSVEVLPSDSRFRPKIRSESVSATLGIPREVAHLRRIVLRASPDYSIVNVHNFPATWSVSSKKPVVWMCNEPPGPWSSPSPSPIITVTEAFGRVLDKRIVASRITKIAVIDQLNYRRVVKRYGITPRIVLSGVDYDFFASGRGSNFRSKFEVGDRPTITQVGWLTPQKNQIESIRVVERLKGKYPDLLLVLCGIDRSDYGDSLKKYVQDKKLEGQVLFTGRISPQDVADLYNASTAVLFPSLEHTWGLSPLEGVCAGAFPIVSAEAGVGDFLRSKRIGTVTLDYVHAVEDVIEGRQEKIDSLKRAREIIRTELSWDAYGRRMEELFEESLRKPDWGFRS